MNNTHGGPFREHNRFGCMLHRIPVQCVVGYVSVVPEITEFFGLQPELTRYVETTISRLMVTVAARIADDGRNGFVVVQKSSSFKKLPMKRPGYHVTPRF